MIRRKPGTSLCIYGIVLDDGVAPPHWTAEIIGEARRRAKAIVAETGGEILESDL